MSKESAMAVATGNPVNETTPAQTSTQTTQTSAPITSSDFNHIAKKESELVKQRQWLTREKMEIESQKKQLAEVHKQYQQYQETKAKDPIAALKMLGFSETDVINYMANQQAEEPTAEQKAAQAAEQAAAAKIQEFEQAQLKKEQEATAKRDQTLIHNFRSEISRAISNNKEKLEYCNHYGPVAEDLAYETVIEVLKASKGKELLTVREALEQVEEYYEEQDKLMSKLRKRQPQTVPAQKSAEPERSRTLVQNPGATSSEMPKPTLTRSRTMSNSTTATVAATRLKMNETREQKRERLINALKNGKL